MTAHSAGGEKEERRGEKEERKGHTVVVATS